MLAADYLITRVNSDGLFKLEQPQTEQTPALTEYRYGGSNDVVKNYVNFSNETWRIIGVIPTDDGTGSYENRLKIMRNESIGNFAWDEDADTSNWPDASLNLYLNNTYYNQLTSEAKKMVGLTKYYLGLNSFFLQLVKSINLLNMKDPRLQMIRIILV